MLSRENNAFSRTSCHHLSTKGLLRFLVQLQNFHKNIPKIRWFRKTYDPSILRTKLSLPLWTAWHYNTPKWLCIKTMLLILPQLELSILNIIWIYFGTTMAIPMNFYLTLLLRNEVEISTKLHITVLKCICKQHSYIKFNKSVRANISIGLFLQITHLD